MKNNKRTNPMISDDEKFELLFKGLLETRDAVLFAVNEYSRPFQTSKEDDERAIVAEGVGATLSEPISNLDPKEKDAVSKYLYLKETLQSLPIEEKKLFVGEYSDRFLERRESEEALGFSKDKDGKVKFPPSFAGFLKHEANSKDNARQDLDAYWSSISEKKKNSLIEKFCNEGRDEAANESAREVIANSYDRSRSKEGLERLEKVISYAVQKSEEQSKKEYDAAFTAPVSNLGMVVAAFSTLFSSAAAQNATEFPTESPSNFPTRAPTRVPSESPTSGGFFQSHRPSKEPTFKPTARPSLRPTEKPSEDPTSQPSGHPSSNPTYKDNNPNFEIPTAMPSATPIATPSARPSIGNNITSTPNNEGLSDGATIAIGVIGGLAALGVLVYGLKKTFCPSTSPKEASGKKARREVVSTNEL
jgi:hypothetical protein